MKQRDLSIWLRVLIAACMSVILAAYLILMPLLAGDLASAYPEMAGRKLPWLVFMYMTLIPITIAAVYAWQVAASIGENSSFTHKNAIRLKRISQLAASDAIYFAMGNLVLLALNMSHPGVTLLLGTGLSFIGIVISVAAAALSHLTEKAAALQDDNDLTI